MQLAWLVGIPVTFVVGFLAGYFVRALKSRRRRRWSTWARSREVRHAGILQPSPVQEPLSSGSTDSLRRPADVPPLSPTDETGHVVKGPAAGSRNFAQSGVIPDKNAAKPRRARP
jgi:hypothetical protein